MNKLLSIFLLFALVSCSIDRLEETQVIEGLDGMTTLVNSSTEGQGENCENGGVKLEFGVDTNFNGVLESDEVTSTAYVCNGLDGEDASPYIVDVIVVDGTGECPNGGVSVVTGIDLNGNGTLDAEEYQTQTFICNGTDGTDGQDGNDGTDGQDGNDGTDGNDGSNTIVDTKPISEEDERCTSGSGGVEIIIGVDDNRNSVLDEEEIDSIEVICNGQDGISMVFNSRPSNECLNGGSIIEVGLDTNRNDVLDPNEVINSFEICNGIDGLNSLIRTVDVGDGCIQIYSGQDLNANGTLDENEQGNPVLICDGEDGTDGQDGEDGEDGQDGTSVGFDVTVVESSQECPNGGSRITTWLDFNGNGVLDGDETAGTISVICNGVSGQNGTDGTDGDNGEDGEDGISPFINLVTIPACGSKGTASTNNRIKTPCSGNGGVLIQIWVDTNGNTELDEGEVVEEYEVLNGTDGQDGTDGNDGNDGNDGEDGNDGNDGADCESCPCVLVIIEELPPSDECQFGGIAIRRGIDDNENGTLEQDEIEDTQVICNDGGCINVETSTKVINFENGLLRGDIVSLLPTSSGVISVIGINPKKNQDENHAMIFDTRDTNQDTDLVVPNGNNGNVLIIANNAQNDQIPNDNAFGGVFRFDFTTLQYEYAKVNSFLLIDNESDGSEVKLTFKDGNTETLSLPETGDQQQAVVDINRDNVITMEITLEGSGAIDNINLDLKRLINTCH